MGLPLFLAFTLTKIIKFYQFQVFKQKVQNFFYNKEKLRVKNLKLKKKLKTLENNSKLKVREALASFLCPSGVIKKSLNCTHAFASDDETEGSHSQVYLNHITFKDSNPVLAVEAASVISQQQMEFSVTNAHFFATKGLLALIESHTVWPAFSLYSHFKIVVHCGPKFSSLSQMTFKLNRSATTCCYFRHIFVQHFKNVYNFNRVV